MNETKNIFLIIMLLVLQAQLYGTIQNNKNQTQKEINMEDRLDFNLLDKYARKTHRKDSIGEFVYYSWLLTENDTITQLFGNTRRGFTVWQTPPPPAFYRILKSYHPNGYLKMKGRHMGRATMVGVWEYYDESGRLLKTVDEDIKFGKFGYNELLLFLQREGHINIETGENREKTRFAYNIMGTKQWGVSTMNSRYWVTEYIIDGETGEVIDKKEYQGGIE